jgi:hypothetical protein
MEDGEYTREDWFIDEDEHLPWWMCVISWLCGCVVLWAIAIALFFLAMGIKDAMAAPNPNPPPITQDDPNEVRIGVMCGDLQGSGAVVIVDPPQGKVYKFDFTCPTGTSI